MQIVLAVKQRFRAGAFHLAAFTVESSYFFPDHVQTMQLVEHGDADLVH